MSDFGILWTVVCQAFFCPRDSPGNSTGVGCHALLQGIVPTQGWNPCLSVSRTLASQIFATSATWEAPVSLQGESKFDLYYFTVQFLPLLNYAFVFLPHRCWSPEYWIINTLHVYFHLRMHFFHWESVMGPEVRWENRHEDRIQELDHYLKSGKRLYH